MLLKNPIVRKVLITVCLSSGLFLIFSGFQMTGELQGLLLMILGLMLLLASLYFWNFPYRIKKEDRKKDGRRKKQQSERESDDSH